ncbi:peroxiredoxin [Magnetospirillum moscoviense]|uniref:thioredoxin-dependent peroxiredoxin n=1 Tax=Magnetospirillum moscoviense TaxID=1437059 RepID=A0A178MME7_9PROT|nr:peroxiredoxin [Magnetospirillum moscoviense]OAN49839.1 peroxiredoxin [Magnetospirillum moscoviense]
MSVSVGQAIPAFETITDEGPRRLADYAGRKLVLYFYPKDDTSGCTTEAKQFRDAMAEFEKAGAAILGVSKDSLTSHAKFRAKHELPFPLASDETGALCELFGVWKQKSMYGRTYMGIERSTFLIDEQGVLMAEWRKVKVTGHAADILKRIVG